MLRILLFLTLTYFSLSGSIVVFIVGGIIYSVRYIPYELLLLALFIDAFALGTEHGVLDAPFVLVASSIIFARIIVQPYIQSDFLRI